MRLLPEGWTGDDVKLLGPIVAMPFILLFFAVQIPKEVWLLLALCAAGVGLMALLLVLIFCVFV